MKQQVSRNTYELRCDECEFTVSEEFTYSEFEDAIREWKAEGGVVLKEDGQWKHICKDCTK
jgi:hypothetical protein